MAVSETLLIMLLFSPFDITQQGVHDLIQLLTGVDCPDMTSLWVSRILLWLIFIGVPCLFLSKYYFKPLRKRKEYIRNHMDNGFPEYYNNSRYYIDARFQNIQPNMFPDILESIRQVSSENMIDKYLKDIFTEKNIGSPLYCVLGGSGMGKTSFLTNVMESYVKTKLYPEKLPFQINLVNLANESYKSKIQEIENQKTPFCCSMPWMRIHKP